MTVIRQLVLVFILSSTAFAQERQPFVELGGVVSMLGWYLPGVGLRAGGGNGGRVSVEGEIDWTDAIHDQHYPDQMTWFFFWQVKHTLGTEGLFVTYGTAGWVERWGSRRGLESAMIPPFLPMVGLGWQREVAERRIFRVDGQFLIGPFESTIVIPRVSAGVSVPIRLGR
jgi:hypothetical protein